MQSNTSVESGSQSQKKKRNKGRSDTDGFHLVRCSSSSFKDDNIKIKKQKKEKKKEKEEQQFAPSTTTITQNISISRSITVTTPAEEDPDMNICLYLCIENNCDPAGHRFRWCKISPTTQSLESGSEPVSLSPISYMPPTTPAEICIVASSSDFSPSSKKTKKKKKKKLVYAVGGETYEELPQGMCRTHRSSRAFVCDFGSKSLAWEELPPMSRPKLIHMGVVSPSDGKLYVFGNAAKEIPIPPPHMPSFMTKRIKNIPRGDVFDPSSSSWTRFPAPPKYEIPFSDIDDYTFDKEENKLAIFSDAQFLHTFDLTTLEWSEGDEFDPLHPLCENESPVSSSVVVGDTIYKYHIGELYAMDKTSDSPSFERVPGLAKKLDSDMSDPECIYKGYLSYLGKGKFALVWGGTHFGVGVPEDALYITCVKFWVGVCDYTNRRRALIDRREEYVAQGYWLHDCVAL